MSRSAAAKVVGLRARLQGIPARSIHWMRRAEELHRTKIFFADDAPGKSASVLANGTALGFVAAGKRFTVSDGWRASRAVRAFIDGTETVCEHEGLMHAVFSNAICDVVGDEVFDIAFSSLSIGTGSEIASFMPSIRASSEATVQLGDWVYVRNQSRGLCVELGLESGRGAAAGGWNLLCVDVGPQKAYVGVGLTSEIGRAEPHTLAGIKEMMTAAVAPPPVLEEKAIRELPEMRIAMEWYRRVDLVKLHDFIVERLALD